MDKKITLQLRGVKAIVIYHADEDYYALEIGGMLHSFNTFKEVQTKFTEYVERLIYKDTLILRDILTEPDFKRRDFTMLDYFTALINYDKAKAERSPESYMWEKVIRAFEAKKSRKRLYDIKEQMELMYEEIRIVSKRKKEEKKEEIVAEQKMKIELPKKYDGIVITKNLNEAIEGFKYKYGIIPPIHIIGNSIVIEIGDNSIYAIPKYKLLNYIIPIHLTTKNLILVMGKDGDIKLQYNNLGKWVIK